MLIKSLFIFLFLLIGIKICYAHPLTQCMYDAGNKYSVNPEILWAIAKVESSFDANAINKNKNGSYDYGVMQINSIWAKTIGYENWSKLSDPCYNIHVGAWILSQCIARNGYNWKAIGCYNSSTPGKREVYANKVYKVLIKMGKNKTDTYEKKESINYWDIAMVDSLDIY